MNKKKIINDPIYGFINIHSDLIFDLIEHPYFQRLRRIRQLGLTNLVYPGANHTRFQHALGSFHLLSNAIAVLRAKDVMISPEEEEGATIAILLHDIGHGPFSHALEHYLIGNIHHEVLSGLFMEELNKQFNDKLELAIAIFNGNYHKHFLHELVSGQLDMDRLDYLKRDSFFTGVTEGVVGSDRIIKMLNVRDDRLVIEAKGIYSIEKFLIARRLMYWQVYLHKTVLSAEQLLNSILRRVKHVAKEKNEKVFATPALHYFLHIDLNEKILKDAPPDDIKELLSHFTLLDDSDILASIKVWQEAKDPILSRLCKQFINRNLFKLEIQNTAFEQSRVDSLQAKIAKQYNIAIEDTDYFIISNSITNHLYSINHDEEIYILTKDEQLINIVNASDIINSGVLSKNTTKYFLCYPK